LDNSLCKMRRFRFCLFAAALIGSLAIPGVAMSQDDPGAGDATLLMTPEKQHELFDALDLSPDALKPIAAAVAAGDFVKADHELAEYFRHRTNVAWKYDPRDVQKDPSFKDPVAEDALKGRLQGGLVMAWHTFPGNKIDWHYNETLNNPGLAPNWEWQWQLCRMSVWINLADAYRATGDKRYVDAWLAEFHSFAAECPPPKNMDNSAGSAWRTIDSGIRISRSWPVAFFSFLPASQMTDADIALYLDLSLETARYLCKFHTAGNWLTMEMSGLYTVGAFFPEFKEATDWRTFSANLMRNEETAQFLPDGAQEELSTMYHNVALDSLLNIAHVAQVVGRTNELPDGYIAGLEKAFDFDLHMMTPDRTLPEFNDSTSWTREVRGKCIQALEYFPNRSDFQWLATDGKEGHPPDEVSHAFPWAGYYVMRSSWSADANYLVLRAGPLGAGHAHQDKLNVVVWAYGRQLLFNSGGAAYERSKWRDYSIETFSKNTVLVDGKPQVRDTKNRDANISKAPIDARWESTPDHDFAAGAYDDGYGSLDARLATHTRRVLFVKPDLFVIADTLVPFDSVDHSYQARWNVMTTYTKEDADTQAVTTLDDGKVNMTIVPLQMDNLQVRTASAQTEPELLGWYVRKDATPENIPATTIVQTKEGPGVQNFVTLLVPILSGTASPVKSVASKGSGSATVSYNDGRIFSIVADPDPKGGMEVTETLPNGNVGRHVKVAAAVPH
jgi:Heparinase II/III N-terminus/Heparinase II/III-like protein